MSADWMHIGWKMVKLVIVLLFCNHFISCMWYGIGATRPEDEISWIDFHGFTNAPLGYRYLSALHWTLTQFTPAGMEVYPHNEIERFFSVLVLIFALLFFSSFLSSITSAMTQLRQLNAYSSQQFSLVRRFMKENDIRDELAIRIKKHLEHRVHKQKERVQKQDVRIFALLSEPLHKELQEQIHKPILCEHPFFTHYCRLEPHAMRSLCHHALSTLTLSQGDTVFATGDICEKMIFVMDGNLLYQWTSSETIDSSVWTAVPSAGRDNRLMACYLKEGGWCSEACLWATWVHRGTMQAVSMGNLLAIDAEKFVSVTLKHTMVMQATAIYAQNFVKNLNTSFKSPNDLSQTKEEIEQMCKEVFEKEEGSVDLSLNDQGHFEL
eukprot:gnl/MRDRNA2_/MRDRNA2_140797_c0_seq1.p1 gnl/MRDRNA2_/MRDRNA2_140797_c0~~gnl/MRDRNA2_/MRDRNA2_140797_c0_seq1.p1  ORF type:complete len:390 (+),score=34.86 gnl/MRDRNA2_/MRDRNA2_140797_c0_seq1:31-1170(+)